MNCRLSEWFQALSGVYSKLKVQPVVGITLQAWQSTGGSFWATQALFHSSPAQKWSDYATAIANGIRS